MGPSQVLATCLAAPKRKPKTYSLALSLKFLPAGSGSSSVCAPPGQHTA